MIISGGIYDEIVVDPDSHEIFGSGLRAAGALANRDDQPVLIAPMDDASEEEATLVADALGVTLDLRTRRSERVGFRYITPISAPAVNGPNSRLVAGSRITGSDATALVFGLIEASVEETEIRARTVVYDPQRPRDAEPLNLGAMDAENFVVVANSKEIRRLGRHSEIREAASNVLAADPRVSGVVTKRGAAGCLITRRHRSSFSHTLTGAHPTARVWPIGSGDTFSAGLAHGLDVGLDLIEAAEIGSAAAAYWCSTRSPTLPRQLLDGDFSMLARPLQASAPVVYLAGPFFSVAERWLVESVRDELTGLGCDVWSPVHEVGSGGLEVAAKDIEGLERSDVVLALLDHGDPGTVFEVGWAVKMGIPVIGYGNVGVEGAKMLAGTRVELHRDLSTACYRAAWAGMGLLPRPGWLT